MPINASDAIALSGSVQTTATYPEYTRMTVPLSKPSVYFEFPTSSVLLPQTPVPEGTQQVTVRVDTPIYFNDETIPPPEPIIIHPRFRSFDSSQPSATGLVLLDGSPVYTILAKGNGPITGISGTDKTGVSYDISIVPSTGKFPGRLAGNQSTWAFCHANIKVGNQPGIQMGVGYGPADLLITHSLMYGDILTLIEIDLVPVVGSNGFAKVNRTLTYQGKTISFTTVNMPTGGGAPMHVAASALEPYIFPIMNMSPAVASIRESFGNEPQLNSLAELNTLEPKMRETQESFVNRGLFLTSPSLTVLLSLFGQTPYLGFSDLSQLLGRSFAGLGRANVEAALTDFYITYEEWLSKQSGNAPFKPYRSQLDTNSAGFGQRANS